jgi:hypothetical protein
MRITFLVFIIFSISTFAKSIGSTSLGLDFGEITSDHQNAGSVEGLYWDLGLNFNMAKKDSSGLDLSLNFAYSNDVNNEGQLNFVSYKYTQFDYSLRPYMKFSDFIIFAELGGSRIHLYEDDQVSRLKSNSFVPTLGFKIESNKLSFTPSIDYLNYGDGIDSGFKFNVPIGYSLSENFDLNIKYSHSDIDPYTLKYISVGFDLSFQ